MNRKLLLIFSLILIPATLYGLPLSLDTFVQISEKERPGVVNISTTRFAHEGESFAHPPIPRRPPFPEPFGPFREPGERSRKQRSLGSGFIVDPSGLILTNDHVVSNVDEIIVKLADDREYPATLVGTDPSTDLALLKIELKERETIKALELGNSDEVKVGEWVVAIGSPFGFPYSVTVGVVSAKGRAIGGGPYEDYIQTDASINPGNSGGPLLNAQGKVVGINTAIISAGQGLGFAIPINQAKAIMAQLKTRGQVVRGWLGITPQAITPDMAEALKLASPEGIIVADLVKGQPAETAGIQVGDVITSFDSKKISDLKALFRAVAEAQVGKETQVELIRDSQKKVLKVSVGTRPDSQVAARSPVKEDALGLTVEEITAKIKEEMNLSSGVLVEKVVPGSLADRADLAKGDVILKVNGQQITSPAQFNNIIQSGKKGEALLIYARRGERGFFTALRLS